MDSKDTQIESLEEAVLRLLNSHLETSALMPNYHAFARYLLADPAILAHIPAYAALREENERIATTLADERLFIQGLQSQLAALQGGAVEVAEGVRKTLAEKYQRGIDTNSADMGGNCDWARLEGAVKVVQALRTATPQPTIDGKVPQRMIEFLTDVAEFSGYEYADGKPMQGDAKALLDFIRRAPASAQPAIAAKVPEFVLYGWVSGSMGTIVSSGKPIDPHPVFVLRDPASPSAPIAEQVDRGQSCSKSAESEG